MTNADASAWGNKPPIDVDTTTSAWQSVVRYAQARIDALEKQALAPSTSHEDRHAAVIRRDELVALLRAPTETQRRVAMQTDRVAPIY